MDEQLSDVMYVLVSLHLKVSPVLFPYENSETVISSTCVVFKGSVQYASTSVGCLCGDDIQVVTLSC